jgi:short-subunit dehydrogenase
MPAGTSMPVAVLPPSSTVVRNLIGPQTNVCAMPTALVTGATAGIGAAFARRLVGEGYSVVLVARDAARLSSMAASLGGGAEVLSADLSTESGIALVESRLESSPVDLLVNNAGFGHRGRFLDVPVADELTMLTVHVDAVLRLTSAAVRSMVPRGRGDVVNVASVAAFFPRGTYGASKAWVVSFSEAVRQDLAGSGVRVMALCPGFTHTEFHDRAGMDMSGIPSRLWLSAESVVDGALRDLRADKAVSVPGWQYKAMVYGGRLMPRGLSARIASSRGRRFR